MAVGAEPKVGSSRLPSLASARANHPDATYVCFGVVNPARHVLV